MAGERVARFKIEAENKAQEGIKSAVRDLIGLDDAAKKAGNALKGAFTIIGVVEATRKIADFGRECVTAFADAERSQLKLKAAFDGNATATARAREMIDKLAGSTLESKEAVGQMVSSLAALGKTPAQMEALSKAAINLSNATGKGLNDSMNALLGTFQGTSGELQKFVPELANLTKAQLAAGGAADVVNEKLGKISAELAGGAAQKIKNLGQAFDNLKEAIGQTAWYAPIVDGITAIVQRWADAKKAANEYYDAIKRADQGKANARDDVTIAQKKRDDAQTAYDLEIKFLKGQGYTGADAAKMPTAKKLNDDLQAALSEFISAKAREARSSAAAEDKAARAAAAAEAEKNAAASRQILTELTEKFAAQGRWWDYFGGSQDEKGDWAYKFAFDVQEATRNLQLDSQGKAMLAKLTDALDKLRGAVAGPSYSSASGGEGWWNTPKVPTSATLLPNGQSPDGPVLVEVVGASSGDVQTAAPTFFKEIASGVKDAFQCINWQSIFGQGSGMFSAIISQFGTALQGVATQIAAKLGPLWAVVVMILQGFAALMEPAINGILRPLIQAFQWIGKSIALMLMPLIDVLGESFGWVAKMILENVLPTFQTLAPVIQLAATLMEVFAPVLKLAAAVMTAFMAPVKYVGDLFVWLANLIQAFGKDLKAGDFTFTGTKMVGEFKSDAFTGLKDRLEAIMKLDVDPGMAKGTAGGTGSWADILAKINSGIDTIPLDFGEIPAAVVSPTGSAGAGATYTGGQDITINFYNSGNVVSDEGITKLAIEISNIIDNRVRLGVA